MKQQTRAKKPEKSALIATTETEGNALINLLNILMKTTGIDLGEDVPETTLYFIRKVKKSFTDPSTKDNGTPTKQ